MGNMLELLRPTGCSMSLSYNTVVSIVSMFVTVSTVSLLIYKVLGRKYIVPTHRAVYQEGLLLAEISEVLHGPVPQSPGPLP